LREEREGIILIEENSSLPLSPLLREKTGSLDDRPLTPR
jgi:hypothetical protein